MAGSRVAVAVNTKRHLRTLIPYPTSADVLPYRHLFFVCILYWYHLDLELFSSNCKVPIPSNVHYHFWFYFKNTSKYFHAIHTAIHTMIFNENLVNNDEDHHHCLVDGILHFTALRQFQFLLLPPLSLFLPPSEE